MPHMLRAPGGCRIGGLSRNDLPCCTCLYGGRDCHILYGGRCGSWAPVTVVRTCVWRPWQLPSRTADTDGALLASQARYTLVLDMITRTGAEYWPRYGTAPGYEQPGIGADGFQEIFTASMMASLEWGCFTCTHARTQPERAAACL